MRDGADLQAGQVVQLAAQLLLKGRPLQLLVLNKPARGGGNIIIISSSFPGSFLTSFLIKH